MAIFCKSFTDHHGHKIETFRYDLSKLRVSSKEIIYQHGIRVMFKTFLEDRKIYIDSLKFLPTGPCL